MKPPQSNKDTLAEAKWEIVDGVCQKTPISAELRASWPWFAYV